MTNYDAYGDVTPEPADAAGKPLPVSHIPKETRQWLYGIAATGVPILSIYSSQVEGTASLILALVAAVLGLGAGATAVSNTVALPKA